MILKVKLVAVLLIISVLSIANISSVTWRSATVTTNYLNVMQNESVYIQDPISTEITININDKIKVHIVKSPVSLNVVAGSEFLDSGGYSGSYAGNICSFSFRLKWQNDFLQDTQYTVTIDADQSATTVNYITYNEAVVIQTFNISANSLYKFANNEGLWFKGGIGPNESLKCTGLVSYKYNLNVYPLKETTAKIYFEGNPEGTIVNVGLDGKFEFSNFYLPVSASISKNIELKILIDFGQAANAFLDNTIYPNTKNINLDNQPPALGLAAILLLPDLTDEGGDGILPETGWYDQLTVSVQLVTDNLSDGSGAGIKDQILYKSINQQFYASPNITINIKTIEGVGREIQALIPDNVYNIATLSVFVSVDVSVPGIFYVSIDDDKDASANQFQPESGWYNDETVSFSWTLPPDVTLKDLPFQIRSDVGWSTWSAVVDQVVSINQFQNTRNVSSLFVMEGGNVNRYVYVRAVDKAGNIKEVNASLKVDKTPPTVNYLTLIDDTTRADGQMLPEKSWYNDGTEVRWMWSASDAGSLPNQPYLYKNTVAPKNTTSNWINLTDVVVDTSVCLTGNTFYLWVKDMAGNVQTTTGVVYVNETAPSFNNYTINFEPDMTDNNGDGVFPNIGWYDQATLNISLTWNIDSVSDTISRLFLKTDKDTAYLQHQANAPTFSNYEVIPQDNTPIIFTALFVDKAGWTKSINLPIRSDITPPNNFNLSLVKDTDSMGDGIDPEIGWYDDDTIDINWQHPLDSGTLRNTPYFIKVNDNAVGWQSETNLTQFAVSANSQNMITVLCADEAGNVVSSSVIVTVDVVAPEGDFSLVLIPDVAHGAGVTPESGWYCTNNVIVSFVSEDVADNFGCRDNRYFIKNDLGKASFGDGFAVSQNISIFTTEGGSLTHYILGAIVDHAGNVLNRQVNVFVDLANPSTFYANILPDTTEQSGLAPEIGWYNHEAINVVWNQSNDDGQLPQKPYRLGCDTTPNWTAFQNELFYNNFEVLEGGDTTRNVSIQVRDKAGNLTLKNLTIKVDKTPPQINSFNVMSQLPNSDPKIPADVVLPLPGWYSQHVVTISWGPPIENGQLRDNPYKVRVVNGGGPYTTFNNSLETTVDVSVGSRSTVDVCLFVVDRAGNNSVATLSIMVDTSPPTATLNFTISRNFMKPYVIPSDVLIVSLEVSEEIVVTPMLRYYLFVSSNISYNVDLIYDNGVWRAHQDISALEDGWYNFSVTIFDNAGNKTTTVNGDSFFVVRSNVPPAPSNFKVTSMTGDNQHTNMENNKVTFNVDSLITKYWITEEPNPDWAVISINSFQDYPLQNDYYNFANNSNGLKTLYLWVANAQGVVASQSVSCYIYFDNTPPVLRFIPNDEVGASNGDVYNNITVPRGQITGKLQIFNKLAYEDSSYIEAAIVTPFAQVVLPGLNYPITVNLHPMIPFSEDYVSNNYRGVSWMVTYDTSLAQISGNAFFRASVTDNALNVSNIITDGGTFNVNVDAASNPKIFLYSLDGRTNYTRWVTINVVISKDQESSIYDAYKIVDSSAAAPYDSVSTLWPGGNKISVNAFRLDISTDQDNVLEGRKDIYAWVRKGSYLNPGIVKASIIYDKTAPTFSMQIAMYKDKTSPISEELKVTVFVCEKIDELASANIYLLNEDRINTINTSTLEYLKFADNQYQYITTINMPADKKTKNNFLRLVVSDYAGNTLDNIRALRQQLVIKEYIDSVDAKHQYAEQGATDYLFMSCVVSANDQPIHLKGIKLQFEGHYIPSDIKTITVYLDGDGNSLFEPKRKYDTVKGSGEKDLDETRILYVPFDQEELIVSSNPKRFFVVADIGVSAAKGNNISFKFASSNAFTVADNEIVDYGNWINSNFKTKIVDFVKPLSRVVVNGMVDTGISPTLSQGLSKMALKKFKLNTDVGTVLWSGVKISYSGNISQTNLSNLALYKDIDFNQSFNKDIDVLISNGTDCFSATSKLVTVNLKVNQPINNQSDLDTYFIVGDVSISASVGATLSISVVKDTDFIIETPNLIVGTSLPMSSQVFKVVKYISKVSINYRKNTDEDIYQGDSVVLLKYNLAVDFNNPILTYMDFILEGTAAYTDLKDIDVYALTPSVPYNNSNFDKGDSVKIPATNIWYASSKRLRVNFNTPITLVSNNSFALVVTVDNNANYENNSFLFSLKYISATANPYVNIIDGTAYAEKTITTSTFLILDLYKPTQPKISGNYYSRSVQNMLVDYDSYTKRGIISKIQYRLGTTPGGVDILALQEAVLNKPSIAIVDEPLLVNNIILQDNTKYYLSLNTISNRPDNPIVDYFSKTAVFEFKTDFSPPHMPGYPADIVVGESDLNNISHQLSWGEFEESESGIARYTVEEKSNYSPSWSVVRQIAVADPTNLLSTERRALFLNRKPNMSYTYRIKAQNLPGLQSEYVYSAAATTIETDKVLSQVSNYPNPFYSRKETTNVFYFLNQNTGIEIKIYDALGHFVKKLNYSSGIQGKTVKGDCVVEWNGKDESGQFVEKGGYFVVIEAPQAKGESKKVVRMVGVIH